MKRKPEDYITSLLSEGFSEQCIAEHAKVSQSTINRIKQRKIQSPRWETVEKIIKFHNKIKNLETWQD